MTPARLVLLGEAPPRLVDAVVAGLPRPFFPAGLGRLPIPYDACYDRSRAQLDAVLLLERLEAPPPGRVLVALLGVDLFLPPLAYVFGLSEVGGRRGLVSWARLRPPGEDEAAGIGLIRRLRVETAHELGHAAGLLHCVVPDCPMHRSLWPEAIDLKGLEYCPTCLEALDAAATEQDSRAGGSI